MKSILHTFLFFFLSLSASAQCPPSAQGHHRVLKGETLYKISKKYKVSVEQLCIWNDIQPKDILDVCQEIWVTLPSFNSTPNNPTKPINNALPQKGGMHRIKQGETIAGLAELYGYTEQRFRDINGLSPSEPSWLGLVLKTSDCICTEPTSEFDPVYTDNSTDGNIGPEEETSFPEQPSFPTWEEAIASNEDDPTTMGRSNPFGEDPYNDGRSPITLYNKVDKRVNTPTGYANETGRITAPNSPQSSNSSAPASKSLDPKVRRSEVGENAPDKTFVSPEEELIRKQRKIAPTTSPNLGQNTSVTGKPSATIAPAKYMTAEEIEMVAEINLVRSNPPAYVKYIEAFKQEAIKRKDIETASACDELIAELKRTSPLSILEPTECIYAAAKKHGEDQRPTGSTEHVGTDGSYPWDRIRRECLYMTDGRENLVSGSSSVRKSVMLLLVDKGISNRGHRQTILDKTWKYVACYNIGALGRYQNNWVQKFGK